MPGDAARAALFGIRQAEGRVVDLLFESIINQQHPGGRMSSCCNEIWWALLQESGDSLPTFGATGR